eukprot:scaffold14924_cov19-Tisochrysis_lutea.AAC.1
MPSMLLLLLPCHRESSNTTKNRQAVLHCTLQQSVADSVELGWEEVLIFPTKDNPDLQKVKVPKGHVWLQGDNLLHSRDSREYGPIPLALVKGRVLYQLPGPSKCVVTRSIPADLWVVVQFMKLEPL